MSHSTNIPECEGCELVGVVWLGKRWESVSKDLGEEEGNAFRDARADS